MGDRLSAGTTRHRHFTKPTTCRSTQPLNCRFRPIMHNHHPLFDPHLTYNSLTHWPMTHDPVDPLPHCQLCIWRWLRRHQQNVSVDTWLSQTTTTTTTTTTQWYQQLPTSTQHPPHRPSTPRLLPVLVLVPVLGQGVHVGAGARYGWAAVIGCWLPSNGHDVTAVCCCQRRGHGYGQRIIGPTLYQSIINAIVDSRLHPYPQYVLIDLYCRAVIGWNRCSSYLRLSQHDAS